MALAIRPHNAVIAAAAARELWPVVEPMARAAYNYYMDRPPAKRPFPGAERNYTQTAPSPVVSGRTFSYYAPRYKRYRRRRVVFRRFRRYRTRRYRRRVYY